MKQKVNHKSVNINRDKAGKFCKKGDEECKNDSPKESKKHYMIMRILF